MKDKATHLAKRLSLFLAALVLPVLITACTATAAPAPTATPVPAPIVAATPMPTTAPAAAATPMPTTAPAMTAGIKVATDAKLGQLLTDDRGMTLYLYTKDTPNTTNCYDACATNWPPAIVGATVPALPMGTPGKLSVVTRTDGGKQLAYNGQPLYYWLKDTKPGDTTGQGVGSVWYVLTPSDAPVTPAKSG
ncbi:MAG TPA: hypothetical protein VIK32_16365 [Candidatus Limnocylindrales bacterium]